MAMNQQQARLDHNPWLKNLFHPLVVGVMFGCIALSLVELVHLIFPTWNAMYLIVGCVLAALEANYSYRLIKTWSLRGADLLRYRVIELTMFFLLLKIGSYVGDSWTDVLAEVQTWPHHLFNVIDLETMAAFILAFLSWHISTQTVRDFERLGEPPEHHRYYVSPMESLTGRFFWGGTVLLIAAGLTRIGVAQLLNLRRPPVPGLVLNVLVYFLLGLVMLGQVRLSMLRKRWQAQKIKVADELAGRWVRYSLAFIGLAALLAFLLPTGYTLGLLEAVGYVVTTIIMIISFIATLFLLIITLPLTWLLSLLGGDEYSPAPPRLSQPQLLQPAPADAAPDWVQILRSLAFWAIALGMVFYVVRSYLRDHPELWEALSTLGLIGALRRFWTALWRWLGGWAQSVSGQLPRHWPLRLTRRFASPGESFRFFRLGALSPRDQVLYYFLSILRRAGQQGFPRRSAQTPYEYKATLTAHLPQSQREMDLLTQAFVEARYSQHIVDRGQARRVRANWQRVKAALQAIKRKQDEEKFIASQQKTGED